MRQQRTQRMSAPAPVRKLRSGVPATGYALIVDGQAKADFKTHEQALKAARDLKGRFPMLQVKIYDAEHKLTVAA
jgi:PP-loop superfamily ATP-utilizing enzyme